MIKFISVTMRNFLSYGNVPTTVRLDTPGTILIVGEDLDNTSNGHGANGVGKSTIINALAYGVYDRAISNISKDNLVNNINKKNMEVTVVFEKDGIQYQIVRARKSKSGASGNYVQLFENGKDITPDSVVNTNTLIEKVIGVTYELFVRIVVFSASHTPFLDLPTSSTTAASQTSLIEELFDLTTLSMKADALKEDIKDTNRRIETKTARVEVLKKEKERHEGQLAAARVRAQQWDYQTSELKRKLQEQLVDTKSINIQQQKQILEKKELVEKKYQSIAHEIDIQTNTLNALVHDLHTIQTEITTEKLNLKKLTDTDIEAQKGLLENKININEEIQHLVHVINNRKTEKIHEDGVLLTHKKEVTNANTWIAHVETNIKSEESQIAVLLQEVEHLRTNICPTCKQSVKNAAELITEYEQKISTITHNIDSEKSNITQLQKSLDTLSQLVDEQQRTIKTIDSALLKDEQKKKELEDTLNKINKQLVVQSLDELYSIQNQRDVIESKIMKAESLLPDKIQLVAVAKQLIQGKENELAFVQSSIDTLKDQLLIHSMQELYELQNQITTIETKLEEVSKGINPFVEPLVELENVKLDTVDYEELNELNKLLDHQKFLLKLLTKKDSFVRKVLINKNIPYLNTRLQNYLSILGLPHKVEFTHEMACTISQFGRPLDFGNLSAGQRARVNIALSFAFRDVLQSIHTHINVCMLDEVLDTGLDAIGVQAAARLLKRKSRDEKLSLYIISHRDEIGAAFDKTITVQLNKGFSYIKEEATT